MMRHIVLLAFAILLLSSCVTNKKVVFMQKDDVNVKDLPKDSIMREYDLPSFDYKIQPNDILGVRFESLTPNEFDFFSATRVQGNLASGAGLLYGELVDDNGDINYPVVGKVHVAGLTIFEAQEMLQTLAEQYLESPVVKVRLLNYRITFLGEVNGEGIVTLPNNRVNLMEAIGHAGGFTELADRKNVKLVRQQGGKTEVIYLDLLDEDLMTSPYYYVHQNDIVIVPPLRQRPYRRYFGTNLGLFVSSLSLLLLIYNLSQN
jgi:polysaccharide export outer membrane protein